jgi:hypothetical protein
VATPSADLDKPLVESRQRVRSDARPHFRAGAIVRRRCTNAVERTLGWRVRQTNMRTVGLGLALIVVSACGVQAGSVRSGNAPPAVISGAHSAARADTGINRSRARRDAPKVVVLGAQQLSLDDVAPHQPARAVWVRTTWAQWSRTVGEPLATSGENPTRAVYIVALLARARLTCRACKGLRVVRGRYAYLVFQVHGHGDSVFVVTNHRPDLASLGTVRTVFAAI